MKIDYATPTSSPRRFLPVAKWIVLPMIAVAILALTYMMGYQAGARKVEESDRPAFKALELRIRAMER